MKPPQLGLFDEQPARRKPVDPPVMRKLRRGRWFVSKKNSVCDSCGAKLHVWDKIWLVPYVAALCPLCKYAHLPE